MERWRRCFPPPYPRPRMGQTRVPLALSDEALRLIGEVSATCASYIYDPKALEMLTFVVLTFDCGVPLPLKGRKDDSGIASLSSILSVEGAGVGRETWRGFLTVFPPGTCRIAAVSAGGRLFLMRWDPEDADPKERRYYAEAYSKLLQHTSDYKATPLVARCRPDLNQLRDPKYCRQSLRVEGGLGFHSGFATGAPTLAIQQSALATGLSGLTGSDYTARICGASIPAIPSGIHPPARVPLPSGLGGLPNDQGATDLVPLLSECINDTQPRTRPSPATKALVLD
eukprot:Hpha_TRINITY_DN32457_c0_g1::TRINITY_DN32457_c0_g1_i1::g.30796::m.30796